MHAVSKKPTLRKLRKPGHSMEYFFWAPSCFGVMAKTARKICLTVCLIWYLINKFECKFEFDCDDFYGWNSCFSITSLTILRCFIIHWYVRFFCVNKTAWISLSSRQKKPNPPDSASIDQTHLRVAFSPTETDFLEVVTSLVCTTLRKLSDCLIAR